MILVVGAAIFRNSLVLACRRSENKELSGFWEFPGGKIEDGETPIAALERELVEELGIKVSVGSLLHTTQDFMKNISLEIYVAQTLEEPTLTDSHDDYRWLRKDELFDIEWAPLDLPIVQEMSKNHFDELWGI